MASEKLEGGCMCGRVRYILQSKPFESSMCHCTDCRKASGSHSVAWVTVPADDFECVGTPTSYASSPGVKRTFCPACGTSLTFHSKKREGYIDIATGSLDRAESYPPEKDLFCEEKLPWVEFSTKTHCD